MKSSNRPRRRVIVRGWGDEPVALFVYRVENKGNTVFVWPDNADGRPIGLPCEQVYDFDADMFSALMSAYEVAQIDELYRLYFELR